MGSALRAVKFIYEDRTDPISSFVAGFDLSTKKRVKRIEMWAPNPTKAQLIWYYQLSYRTSTFSARSELTSIEWCDNQGVCLPKTEFEWTDVALGERPTFGDSSDFSIAARYQLNESLEITSATTAMLPDLNGDGRDDLVYKVADPQPTPGDGCMVMGMQGAGMRVRVASATGLGNVVNASAAFPAMDDSLYTPPFDAHQSKTVDFDGDGAVELLIAGYHFPAQAGGSKYIGYAGYRWSGTRMVAIPAVSIKNVYGGLGRGWHHAPSLLDLNGDGAIDMVLPMTKTDPLVTPKVYKWSLFLGKTNTIGFFGETETGITVNDGMGTAALDTNGDGRMQLVGMPFFGFESVELDKAGTFKHRYWDPDFEAFPGDDYAWTFTDVNGDGLKDALSSELSEGVFVRLNTGQGYLPEYLAFAASGLDGRWLDRDFGVARGDIRTADFNGDGFEDILLLGGTDRNPDCNGLSSLSYPPVVLYSDGQKYHQVTLPSLGKRVRHDHSAVPESGGLTGWGWSGTAIGDVNGDALPDIVQLVKNDQSKFEFEVIQAKTLSIAGGYPDARADVMVAVRDGLKGGSHDYEDRVVYKDLSTLRSAGTNQSNYVKTDGCMTEKTKCLQKGYLVVSAFWSGRATGQGLETSYAYTNGRIDRGGRGNLGFDKIVATDRLAGTETTTTYDLTATLFGDGWVYPGAGKATETWTRSGAVYRSSAAPSNWSTEGESAIHEKTIFETRFPAAGGYYVVPKTNTLEEFDALAASATVRRKVTSTFTYDAFGNTLVAKTVTDGGTTETIASDYVNDTTAWQLGRPKGVVHTRAKGTISDTRTLDYIYYASGALSHVTRDSDSNDAVQGVSYTYNPKGTISEISVSGYDSVASPGGAPVIRKARVDYESLEGIFPRAITNALGQVVWVGYHQGLGVPLIFADANGSTTKARYDGLGRQRETSPTGQASSKIVYTASDLLGGVSGLISAAGGAYAITTTLDTGEKQRVDVDRLGRVMRTSSNSFDGSWIEERYIWDELGRLAQKSLPFIGSGGQYVSNVYDALGRLRTTTNPDGSTTKQTYPSFFETHFFDEANNESYTVADTDGLVVSAFENAKSALGGTAHWIKTQTTYDGFWNPRSVARTAGDATTLTTLSTFDVAGRLIKEVDPARGTMTQAFNGFDEVISGTDAESVTTTFKRDLLGRVVEQKTGTKLEKFVWDTAPNGVGKLKSASSSSTVLKTLSYRTTGQLSSINTIINGTSYSTSISYDIYGRPSVLGYPDFGDGSQFSVRFSYQNGYLKSAENYFTNQPYWVRDALTPLAETEHAGNNLTTQKTYEPKTGRISSIMLGAGAAAKGVSYTYFNTGDVKTRSDSGTSVAESFVYDTLGRLEEWKRTGGGKNLRRAYEYDDFGSISQVKSYNALSAGTLTNQTTYTLGPSGNASKLAVVGDGTYTYSYDKNGRQTQRLLGAVVDRRVDYNYWDLPTRITDSAGATTDFRYDAFGRRASKASTQLTTYYVDELFEHRFKGGAHELVRNVMVEGRTVAQVAEKGTVDDGTFVSQGATVRYLHGDSLGSTVVTSFASQTTKWERAHFEPFGARINPDGTDLASWTSSNHKGFTEHEHDDELGIINMRGRIYDPRLRRFFTPDPFVKAPLFSQGHHPYSYVGNRPLARTDPSGFCDVGATGSDALASGASLPWVCEDTSEYGQEDTGEVVYSETTYGGGSATGAKDGGSNGAGSARSGAGGAGAQRGGGAGGGDGKASRGKPGEGKKPDGDGTPYLTGIADDGGSGGGSSIPAPPTFLDQLGGLGYGFMRGFVPGASFFPTMPGSQGYEKAEALGEILGGLVAMAGGVTVSGGGLTAMATGVGAVPGALATTAGASLIAGGFGNVLNGIDHFRMAAQGDGRGRFKKGKDELEQLEGIEGHRQGLKPAGRAAEGEKTKEAIRSTTKSQQRLDNRLKRLKDIEDAIDEFEE